MRLDLKDREDLKLNLIVEHLRDHGMVQLKAFGTSMLPSLWPGDVLTIQSVALDEAVPGDIVLVLRDNRFFIHRLIQRQQKPGLVSWIIRGDAMPQNDPLTDPSHFLGRVTSIHRAGRRFPPN